MQGLYDTKERGKMYILPFFVTTNMNIILYSCIVKLRKKYLLILNQKWNILGIFDINL